MGSDIVLEIENLTKIYPGAVRALDRVQLTIRQGEIYVLLGPNGAGKTTLFATILGLLRPTQGRIKLYGADLEENPQLRVHVGGFIEDPPFYPHLSAAKNLEIVARLRNRPLEGSRLREVLEFVHLSQVKDRPVGHYSTGMKRRLGIARAILFAPTLILLDEPTSGLDPQGIVEIRTLIKRLHNELGLTILLSTHLLNEAEQLATRVGILKDGRLIREGRLEDWLPVPSRYMLYVREGAQTQQLIQSLRTVQFEKLADDRFLLDLEGVAPEELNSFLVRRGINVKEFFQVRNTLEEIFLAVMGEDYHA